MKILVDCAAVIFMCKGCYNATGLIRYTVYSVSDEVLSFSVRYGIMIKTIYVLKMTSCGGNKDEK